MRRRPGGPSAKERAYAASHRHGTQHRPSVPCEQARAHGPRHGTVGHYSGVAGRAKNLAEGIAKAKSFHQSHLNRGWAGIGYHFLIADDGSIICCRSTFHKGAHVDKKNDSLIGVNMPGTLQGPPLPVIQDRPTRAQARAFNWLLHNAHTAAMPRVHRTDRDLSRLSIRGHKDLNPTSCPGLFQACT